MGMSNQEGHLVLATGNKSELAVGYSTLYGDAVGGLRPAQGRSEDAGLEARAVAQRRGGAPRRDAADPAEQHQQATVGRAAPRPARHRLASRLRRSSTTSSTTTSSRTAGAADLVAAGFDPALVERVIALTDHAEYKRRQYPPGPKISFKAFGRDRRLPITSRWREDIDSTATRDPVDALPFPRHLGGLNSHARQPRCFSTSTAPSPEFESHPDLVRATEGLIVLAAGD